MVISIKRRNCGESHRYGRLMLRFSVRADISIVRTNIRVASPVMNSSSRRPITVLARISLPSLSRAKPSQSPPTETILSPESSV